MSAPSLFASITICESLTIVDRDPSTLETPMLQNLWNLTSSTAPRKVLPTCLQRCSQAMWTCSHPKRKT